MPECFYPGCHKNAKIRACKEHGLVLQRWTGNNINRRKAGLKDLDIETYLEHAEMHRSHKKPPISPEKIVMQKCWFPGCTHVGPHVTCEDHWQVRQSWGGVNSRRRAKGLPELTIEEYLPFYKERKKAEAYNYQGMRDIAMDFREADIRFDPCVDKQSPCLRCQFGNEDKFRGGCVECSERVAYVQAIEFSLSVPIHTISLSQFHTASFSM